MVHAHTYNHNNTEMHLRHETSYHAVHTYLFHCSFVQQLFQIHLCGEATKADKTITVSKLSEKHSWCPGGMKKIDRMDVPMFIILLLHQHNSELRELRVNRNKIATVPASLQLNTRCDLNLCGDSQLKTTVSWFSLKLVFFLISGCHC